MALKDWTRILTCVVYFASLPDMVHAFQNNNFSLFIVLLGVLAGFALIVGVTLWVVYFCCQKRSVMNPNEVTTPHHTTPNHTTPQHHNTTWGVVVTVIGGDIRTIVTSGNAVQEQHPMEQNSNVWKEGLATQNFRNPHLHIPLPQTLGIDPAPSDHV
uniref:Uncharacterized protein LOC111135267 isoform X2 n=1 Tax=Crassostrea virginica TaxID=6565 RepID=A0A8B8ELW2_CRAVI|nr:uncharacterized protein LOC111135267 isoform X2 [Crassostrea virginica]